jgi:sec-independent protein translocase protein TatB
VFNLQGSEIIVILLIALVVLGPERLPDAVRKFMQTYHELRKMSSGFQSEIKAAFDEPMREMRDTAKMVRESVDPSVFIAEAEAEQRLRDETVRNEAQSDGAQGDAPQGDAPQGDAAAPAAIAPEPPEERFVDTPAVPPPPPPPRTRIHDLPRSADDETRAPT